MKYVVKDSWIINKFVEGAAYHGDVVEIEGNLEDILDNRGLPVYKFVDGVLSVASEDEIKATNKYSSWIMANRLKNYSQTNLIGFDYLYMQASGDPKAEEKKQEWIAAVQKVKQEFPKV